MSKFNSANISENFIFLWTCAGCCHSSWSISSLNVIAETWKLFLGCTLASLLLVPAYVGFIVVDSIYGLSDGHFVSDTFENPAVLARRGGSHALSPNRQKQEDLCESEHSKVSSRTSGATEKPCQTKQTKQNKNKHTNQPSRLRTKSTGRKPVNLFAFWCGKLKCTYINGPRSWDFSSQTEVTVHPVFCWI